MTRNFPMTAHHPRTDEAATTFARRHIGPSPRDIDAMLKIVGANGLKTLMSETLPSSICRRRSGSSCRSISGQSSARSRHWRI
jgi:glycine dehydrogenase